MLSSKVLGKVALLATLCGFAWQMESAQACGLRNRCCLPVARPVPCPVVVMPVRVVPVAVMPIHAMRPMPVQTMQPLPVAAGPVSTVPTTMGGQRVVIRTYKITKIRYKVPKKRPAPVICPPAPVVCPPVPVLCPPVICCPAPVICPPICIPRRCCPIRSCH